MVCALPTPSTALTAKTSPSSTVRVIVPSPSLGAARVQREAVCAARVDVELPLLGSERSVGVDVHHEVVVRVPSGQQGPGEHRRGTIVGLARRLQAQKERGRPLGEF